MRDGSTLATEPGACSRCLQLEGDTQRAAETEIEGDPGGAPVCQPAYRAYSLIQCEFGVTGRLECSDLAPQRAEKCEVTF